MAIQQNQLSLDPTALNEMAGQLERRIFLAANVLPVYNSKFAYKVSFVFMAFSKKKALRKKERNYLIKII
jgi:hypothetical protein